MAEITNTNGAAENGAEAAASSDDLVKGVFSTKRVSYIGSGTTRRKSEMDMYYYIEEIRPGRISRRPLNDQFVPVGVAEYMEKDELLEKFTAEPEVYAKKTIPALKTLQATIARADRMRNKGEHYTAEWEYTKALQMDETNVRATFGLGLTYLEREEKGKAEEVFQKLVTLEEAFDVQNKHLFNEFGIKLRKSEMFDHALKYYAKAFKQSPRDEHILYNITRIYIDQGDTKKALACIHKAVTINPKFAEGVKLFKILKAKLLKEKQAAQG